MIIADFQRYKNGENGILVKVSDRGFSKRLIFWNLVEFGAIISKNNFCTPIPENQRKTSDCRKIFVAILLLKAFVQDCNTLILKYIIINSNNIWQNFVNSYQIYRRDKAMAAGGERQGAGS